MGESRGDADAGMDAGGEGVGAAAQETNDENLIFRKWRVIGGERGEKDYAPRAREMSLQREGQAPPLQGWLAFDGVVEAVGFVVD